MPILFLALSPCLSLECLHLFTLLGARAAHTRSFIYTEYTYSITRSLTRSLVHSLAHLITYLHSFACLFIRSLLIRFAHAVSLVQSHTSRHTHTSSSFSLSLSGLAGSSDVTLGSVVTRRWQFYREHPHVLDESEVYVLTICTRASALWQFRKISQPRKGRRRLNASIVVSSVTSNIYRVHLS